MRTEGGGLFRFEWWVGVGYPGIPFRGVLVHCAPPKFSVRHSTSAAPSVTHCGADAGCVGVIPQDCTP